MKTGVMIALTISLVLAIAYGTGFYIYALKNEIKEAQIKVALLQAAQKIFQEAEARAKAARQVVNEKAKEREQLMQNVLGNNCDWSATVLPDDIARMLSQNPLSGNSSLYAPAILLDDCHLPSRDGVKTLGDLVKIIIADEMAINEHNANMQVLREYRAGLLQKGYGNADHN